MGPIFQGPNYKISKECPVTSGRTPMRVSREITQISTNPDTLTRVKHSSYSSVRREFDYEASTTQ